MRQRDQKARGSVAEAEPTKSMWTRDNPCWQCQEVNKERNEEGAICSWHYSPLPPSPNPPLSPSFSLPLTVLAVQWAWRVVSYSEHIACMHCPVHSITACKTSKHCLEHFCVALRLSYAVNGSVLFCAYKCVCVCLHTYWACRNVTVQ